MTIHIVSGQEPRKPPFPGAGNGRQRPLLSMGTLFTKELSGLLLSTAMFEVDGNIGYVMLMERTFDLGGEATSVGVFLELQNEPFSVCL